jgi:para-aminobenzoate synthetase component I
MSRAHTTVTEFAAREIDLPVEELLQRLLNLEASRRVSILDSCGARPPDARYLIAGFDPFEIVEARGDRIQISRPHLEDEVVRGDVLEILDRRLESYHSPAQPDSPVAGACIASFSYDLARSFERLRTPAPPASTHEPDAVLAFYDTLVVHDYLQGSTKIVSCAGDARLEEFQESLSATDGPSRISNLGEDSPTRKAESNFTRDEYMRAVCHIKEHIAAGDIYQANLTQQLAVPLVDGLTPEQVFYRLRREHPASFAAFIRRREDAVVSASPERFLRISCAGETERMIEAWPIKGTRPRGKDRLEDARLRSELLGSAKDRAENIMIVDLLRNDLGRICHYGSVQVPELFTIQEHPTLFHLVSKVRGKLREEVRAGALLRATFPCGSITGAPKLRAMEILDQIESRRRALSMGALGYFSFDGQADLSVAIRTMTVREGVASFNVGGGIVADSQPEEEYEESLTKARALLRALGAQL